MTDFAPGDRVHLLGLGTGVVREARNGGRYLVDLKGTTMVVAGRDLTAAESERGSRKEKARQSELPDPERASGGRSSLDLHGKTADEAIEALDSFLNDAILDGRHDVRVIHGGGTGRMKAAVHKRLSQLSAVRAFRLDPANSGVTIVTF
jgi:DNA mismatch repair protein MutS2